VCALMVTSYLHGGDMLYWAIGSGRAAQERYHEAIRDVEIVAGNVTIAGDLTVDGTITTSATALKMLTDEEEAR